VVGCLAFYQFWFFEILILDLAIARHSGPWISIFWDFNSNFWVSSGNPSIQTIKQKISSRNEALLFGINFTNIGLKINPKTKALPYGLELFLPFGLAPLLRTRIHHKFVSITLEA